MYAAKANYNGTTASLTVSLTCNVTERTVCHQEQ